MKMTRLLLAVSVLTGMLANVGTVAFAKAEHAPTKTVPAKSLRLPLLPVAPLPATVVPPTLMATIQAPSGVVATPHIILNAYATTSEAAPNIFITGYFGENEFRCNEAPCALETIQSGRIVFHAETPTGVLSKEISADVEVKQVDGGYRVRILRQAGFTAYSDRCAVLWQLPKADTPYWSVFPQDPGNLNTNKDLYNLAARLMTNGVVDTKSCPNGGWLGKGPNACALDLVRPEMTRFQNQYDLSIWMSGRDNGIPPVLLKTLIEVESQYWPITRHQFMDELGLAQINQLGIDILLRNDPEFYQKSCSTALFDCTLPYNSQPPINQQLLRGTIAKSLDAECPTCQYGINFAQAGNSIGLIGKVLYANCQQANKMIGKYKSNFTYEDAWKLTLGIYHSGWGCMQSAIGELEANKQEVNWSNIEAQTNCITTRPYINKFFTSLYEFDNNLVTGQNMKIYQPAAAQPNAPQSPKSSATAEVLVFLDANSDGLPQDSEYINNVQVEMLLSTGEKTTLTTQNGKATFNLAGVPVGINATFTLPSLFRTATVIIPSNGIIPVKFIFAAPIHPTPTK